MDDDTELQIVLDGECGVRATVAMVIYPEPGAAKKLGVT
jgi:hypothetical protein